MPQGSVPLAEALRRAAEAHRAGRLADAERLYREIVAARPRQADALHSLGVIHAQTGRLPEARRLIGESLSAMPRSAQAQADLANVEREMGRFEAALDAYDRALALAPDHPMALLGRAIVLQTLGRSEQAVTAYFRVPAGHPAFFQAMGNCGIALQTLGRLEEALVAFDKALAANPRYVQAWHNRGLVLQALKRPKEALECHDRAVSLRPDDAKLHDSRAVALQELDRLDDAVAGHRHALGLKPDDPEILNNLGNALHRLRRFEEALATYDQALAAKADHPEALNNRGNALAELRRHREALASFEAAAAIRPDYAEAVNNAGIALNELKRQDEALAAFDRAVTLRPDYAEALGNRATILREMKRFDEAARDYRRALALDPDCPYAIGGLVNAEMMALDWRSLDEDLSRLTACVRAGKRATLPLAFLAASDSPADQLRAARTFALHKFPPAHEKVWTGERYRHDRIRIGYLSGDFRRHPVAHLIAELIERHDRTRFEIIGLSFGPKTDDAIRLRLETAFDRFIDLRQMDDAEAAGVIRDLEIDIVVDLMGLTLGSRTGILARRAAPVQTSYLGFPATMGADYIDYLIADRIVVPDDQHAHYAEKIVTLPDSYQVNDSKRPIAPETPTRAEAGLPVDGFVFCCFNNSYKITPTAFDIWMRLLGRIDGGVLWLLADDEATTRRLRSAAAARGIAPERLCFAPRFAPGLGLAEHLARHRLADLFVDTFPYNAHTTASDALWTGLPVLTVLGTTFAGRVAASLLHAVGLPELVTRNLDDYETMALSLARDPASLAALKARLAANRATCPLFDIDRFRHHMEAAYSTMWERQQRGEPPKAFSVAPLDGGWTS